MKVLVITQTVDEDHDVLGFFVEWLRRLGQRIDSLDVIAQSVRTQDIGDRVRIHSLEKERGRSLLSRHVLLQRLLARRLLRENRVDLILCHMCPEYAVVAFPLARAARRPIFLWYTHGGSSAWLRLAHVAAEGILTASANGFPLAGRKVLATGHGIDLEKFRPTALPGPGPRRVLISVGRISPVKAHEVTIRAMGILVRQMGLANVELRIVGGVPLRSQEEYLDGLIRLVRDENLNDHVRFVGPMPYSTIERSLADAEILVTASRTGSLDKAPLEGMACGRPLVCSSSSYRAELDGLDAELMFCEGDAADLAARLAALLAADHARLQAMGGRLARSVRQRHDLNRLLDRVIEIFRDAL